MKKQVNCSIRSDTLFTDFSLLVARHRNESIFGFGATKDLGGFTVRSDVSFTHVADSQNLPSALVNIDRGFELLGRNAYAWIEAYHSGFGASRDGFFLPQETRDIKIQDGELYTLGRNYIACGGRYELTPLTNLYFTTLTNMQDRSTELQVRTTVSLLQDLMLDVGVTKPLGGALDEFGTRPSSRVFGIHERIMEVFLRLEYYF